MSELEKTRLSTDVGDMESGKEHSPPSSITEPEKPQEAPQPDTEYPPTSKLLLIMFSLYISMFLIALDKTIIATAIPRITDTYNSLADIGWYGSSYMITLCAFQLFWGRIYTFYNPKFVFLTTILVFEVGSAVCGAAPSSTSFIIGRAIAGMGSAGLMNGAVIIVIHTVPLAKRPLYQGLIGAVFGVASVVGPLLGGVFTQQLSWRWCFYINLPIGAVAVAILIFILELPSPKEARPPFLQQLKKLDPIGSIVFLPSVVCLLLALQWGGTTYDWSNWRIILLLVLFVILFLVFIAVQIWLPSTATIPVRIITQRTVAAGFFYCLFFQPSLLVITYYIPLFFQVLKSFSPINSGLATLPSVLSLVVGTIGAGGMVQRFGYPTPFMILATIGSAIGAGLISMWKIDASQGEWIGFQVLFGLSIGMGMQQPSMLTQIILPKIDVPTGVSLMFFAQNLGGGVFISVAENVFSSDLAARLSAIPGLDIGREEIAQLGATKIMEMAGPGVVGTVLRDYRHAIQRALYVGLALACVSLVPAVFAEWRSVKEGKKGEGADVKKTEEAV